jgi:hypothetical protein
MVAIMSACRLAVWAVMAVVPVDELARDRVDLCELNHFYNEHGQLVFDQLIFYDWCPVAGRFQVRAWRMVKSPWQSPQRDWHRDGWWVLWIDGDRLRVVHADAFRETWTQYDPEVVERDHLPPSLRKGLKAP